MTITDLAVLCADADDQTAAVRWYGGTSGSEESGADWETLAQAVARHLQARRPVALGLTCPLFTALGHEPASLKAAGEKADGWWGTGEMAAAAFAAGLSNVVWVLRRIRTLVRAPAFLKWADFAHARNGLFVWEAAMTELPRKGGAIDTRAAVASFRDALPDPTRRNALSVGEAYSLIGSALLRTGWKSNPAVLSTPPLVIRIQ